MSRGAALALSLALVACGRPAATRDVTIRLWAIGREGEVVRQLLPEFERTHPGIHVREQQIPFTAAHEKLLTAYVGNATPDVAQLGNSWIAEFASLHALEPLHPADSADYFPGIWETNRLGDTLYGIPWYVDTRVVFYRRDELPLLPTTWTPWHEAMRRVARPGRYALLAPVNEWATPVVLALEQGAPMLRDSDQYGNFEEPRFRRAFHFYISLFRDGLAPAVSNVAIANRYQSFGNDEYAMTVTGPWDVGEYTRRLPPAFADRWTTAPMPAPDGDPTPGASLAGGSSLVIFHRSAHQDAARALIEYLSAPAQQLKLYALSGDLPPRRSVWQDSIMRANPKTLAFRAQLDHVVALPKIPEIEQICITIANYAEATVRGALTEDAALAALDHDVDHILEKRRWMMRHGH
ncbi:MAG TPA: extracellular solute-binding protein [Gemmatimonadaceae bacterium]|nr:extracellular solute-binding protein [Gemmatimonadaceae bacterium]